MAVIYQKIRRILLPDLSMPDNATPPKNTVIQLENASVCYRIPQERIGTFKEYAIRWLQRKVRHHTFWALQDINLYVQKGEMLGIVGQNGAGKSTLLKLIARVLRPNTGRVWVKGRVVPLLELGAGFHPELSGRENIFLNGTMLGFSRREMLEKCPGIIKFSELEEFIDAPLRTYSTGMAARLGFALATDARPDILIIDEILSVGDEAFQKKCIDRIKIYRDQGATILLVAHDMTRVEETCQRAIWLNHGKLAAGGNVDQVIRAYRDGQGHM
jgi:ABC-type polysaccharide/polyol phosphate transport system ATPase subunit